jgi:hypothetical protein
MDKLSSGFYSIHDPGTIALTPASGIPEEDLRDFLMETILQTL